MSRIQSKFTRHVQRQEDVTYDKEKNQWICCDKTDPELTQILTSANKDMKINYCYCIPSV